MSRRSNGTKLRSSTRYRLLGEAPDAWRTAVEADIVKRGLQRAIEVDESGHVLDGHLRLEIARRHKIDPPVVVRRFATEEEKVEHILKVNLLHRSPGPISWARGFARLLEARGVRRGRGGDRRSEESKSHGETLIGDVAEELGVPRATAFRRLQLAELLEGHPDLAAQVDRGELTPRAALLEVGQDKARPKPQVGANGVSHPARFSNELIEIFVEVLGGYRRVLDPFAGTGRIHELAARGHETAGIEREPEWANLHEATEVGDARSLPFPDESFDAICTSPTYGNRFADHHDARDPSHRRSYKHDLGRNLHPGNSGRLQWGAKYREFHEEAWQEAVGVLRQKGRFVLNIKDHIRGGRRQYVSGWHVSVLRDLGLLLLFHEEVTSPGMRAGANRDLRCPEYVYVFEKEG